MSHTSRMKTVIKDLDAFAKCIENMGGTVRGQGTYKLYSSTETGFGFELSGWRYPLCLTASGELKFDDYHNRWGNTKDLERLKSGYVIAIAKQVAEGQGLYSEMIGENLVIQCQNGETITISPEAVIDVNGAIGSSCGNLTEAFENALGTVDSRECKVDFYSETAKIHLTE